MSATRYERQHVDTFICIENWGTKKKPTPGSIDTTRIMNNTHQAIWNIIVRKNQNSLN